MQVNPVPLLEVDSHGFRASSSSSSSVRPLPVFKNVFVKARNCDMLPPSMMDSPDYLALREKGDVVFVDGINIRFMEDLCVTRKCAVFTTSGAKPQIVRISKEPVPVHNTGSVDLRTNTTITVTPPIAKTAETVRICGTIYPMATVEINKFTRDIRQLLVWLRVIAYLKTMVTNRAVLGAPSFWITVGVMANTSMVKNKLWRDLIEGVHTATGTEDVGEVTRTIASISADHWDVNIGAEAAEDASPLPYTHKQPLHTPAGVLADLVTAVKENGLTIVNDDGGKYNKLVDGPDKETMLVLGDQIKDIHSTMIAFSKLTTYLSDFKPLTVASIQSAESNIIRPGMLMNVILD